MSSLTALPLDASPGFLWSHWLHCHLMHLLGFCDIVEISLIASPPDASPRFLWFHWDLTNCITTWCISWVFVISLTTSPPDASSKFLWSHWLHHHLMHLLSFCDLTGYITTWCTFLYVGMCTPPNKCKSKEGNNNEVYTIWIGSWPKGTTPMMLARIFYVCLYNL